MVGDTGFEPVTSSVSTRRSPPELTAHADVENTGIIQYLPGLVKSLSGRFGLLSAELPGGRMHQWLDLALAFDRLDQIGNLKLCPDLLFLGLERDLLHAVQDDDDPTGDQGRQPTDQYLHPKR
jgi:hypothetical protein